MYFTSNILSPQKTPAPLSQSLGIYLRVEHNEKESMQGTLLSLEGNCLKWGKVIGGEKSMEGKSPWREKVLGGGNARRGSVLGGEKSLEGKCPSGEMS